MALEKVRSTHPKQAKILKELQGLTRTVGSAVGANVNFVVAGMSAEDTILSVIDDAGAGHTEDTAAYSIIDGRAIGSYTMNAANVADTVTINSVVFTAVAGTPAANQWDQSGAASAEATSLAQAINNDATTLVTAVANGADVELTAISVGSAGNSITTVESTAGVRITANQATLSQGRGAKASGTAQCTSVIAGDTYTLNGKTYTAVADASHTTGDFTTFSVGATPTDAECAINLRDAINGRELGKDTLVATASTDTVTITYAEFGTEGNAVAQSQTGGTITLSGANLTGGQDTSDAIRAATAGTGVIDVLWYNKR